MFKVIIYLFLCFNLIHALDISDSKTAPSFCFNISNPLDISKSTMVPLHKNIEVSNRVNSIEEAIYAPELFEEKKHFRRYLRKKRVDKSTWYKVNIQNNQNKSIEKEIFTRWDHTKITMYLVKNKKVYFQNDLRDYKNFQLSQSFILEPHERVQLYLNVKVNKSIDDFYYLYFISLEDDINFMIQKEKFFHNGFFLGILITMMLYNLFMYFSMKSKSYLFLGLYQMMIIFYVSDIRYFGILLLQDFPELSYWLFKIIASFFVSVFSILFTKEFLNTKETMPFFDKLLTGTIFVLAYFQLSASHPVNYAAFLYALYIVVGVYAFIKGNKSALFYIFGFALTVLFYISMNLIKYFDWNIYFEYQSMIQVLGAIEALALSMALYLKIKHMVSEREKVEKEIVETEKMMLIQSRFAAMGEMLASIAHQWRQPLNHLDMIMGNVVLAYETGKLNHKYLVKKSLEADRQLKYMSTTIEDFNSFFSSKSKIEEFHLEEIVSYTLELISVRTKKHFIHIDIKVIEDIVHKNSKNELTQVLLIVLNNAIDALLLNNTEDRKISIRIYKGQIIIYDNAGGVPDEILPKIFDPYFSTKDKKFGTGLGLYTAKMIMDNLIKGKIIAGNNDEGAFFSIMLNK